MLSLIRVPSRTRVCLQQACSEVLWGLGFCHPRFAGSSAGHRHDENAESAAGIMAAARDAALARLMTSDVLPL